MIKMSDKYKKETIKKYLKESTSFCEIRAQTSYSQLSGADLRAFRYFSRTSNIQKFISSPANQLREIIKEVDNRFPDVSEYYGVKDYYSECLELKVHHSAISSALDKKKFIHKKNILKSKLNIIIKNKGETKLSLHLKTLILSSIEIQGAKSKDLLKQVYSLMNGKNIDQYFPVWVPMIKKLFDYNAFMTQRRALWLIQDLKAHICPYCNQINIESDSNKYVITKRHRSALDHFFPKSKFPFLALSIYNLVPACDECNRTKKSDYNTYIHYYHNPHDKGHNHQKIFSINNLDNLKINTAFNQLKQEHIELSVDLESHLIKKHDLFDIRSRNINKDAKLQHKSALKLFKSYKLSSSGELFKIGDFDLTREEFLEQTAGIIFEDSPLIHVNKKFKIDIINQLYNSKYFP